MAKQKDLLNRLADVGEEAITRVAGSQTTSRFMDSVTGLRERMDDLQRKVRGLDELEKRVATLEKQVADLQKPKTTRARASSPARKRPSSSTSRTTTRRKPSGPASSS
jgi:DNA repair ATPase RecN